MKLLIVDDEKIERTGLRMLTSQMEPEIEILEAPNGKAALQILKQRKIDMMMTDIRMPYMTGLELIREARALDMQLQIAIFSGYGEFSYAQEAIQYGVSNYILKPVDPEEFRKTLTRMIGACEETQKRKDTEARNVQTSIRYLFHRYLTTGQEKYLTQLKQEAEQGAEFDIRQIQNLMLIDLADDFLEENITELITKLRNMFGRYIGWLGLGTSQILLVFVKSASDNYVRIAETIHTLIMEQFQKECYIAVSREIRRLEDCYKAYQELEALLENKFYHGEKRIFSYNTQLEGTSEDAGMTACIERIVQAFRQKNYTQMWMEFEAAQEFINRNRANSAMYIKFIFSDLIKKIHEDETEVDISNIRQKIEKIYSAGNLDAIYAVVREELQAQEERNSEEKEDGRRDIENVKQYINSHLADNLGTNMLAEQIYLSPGYLSYIFKKETGVNLSRYIRECRMERAKTLLKDTNMKIVQICHEVGFSNVSYFCQNFKEYCGVSPEKFRRGEMADETVPE